MNVLTMTDLMHAEGKGAVHLNKKDLVDHIEYSYNSLALKRQVSILTPKEVELFWLYYSMRTETEILLAARGIEPMIASYLQKSAYGAVHARTLTKIQLGDMPWSDKFRTYELFQSIGEWDNQIINTPKRTDTHPYYVLV